MYLVFDIGGTAIKYCWMNEAGEIFKYFTIQAVDCCLVCGEFVKRNWHGESPCAEGQSASRYMG